MHQITALYTILLIALSSRENVNCFSLLTILLIVLSSREILTVCYLFSFLISHFNLGCI
jgi:hypothetical protein